MVRRQRPLALLSLCLQIRCFPSRCRSSGWHSSASSTASSRTNQTSGATVRHHGYYSYCCCCGYDSNRSSVVTVQIDLSVMAELHYRTQTRIRTRIRISNPITTLYCAEDLHITQTRTLILLPISA